MTTLAVLSDGGFEVEMRRDHHPLGPADLMAVAAEYDGLVCLLTDRVDAALLAACRDREQWPLNSGSNSFPFRNSCSSASIHYCRRCGNELSCHIQAQRRNRLAMR